MTETNKIVLHRYHCSDEGYCCTFYLESEFVYTPFCPNCGKDEHVFYTGEVEQDA